ncbi:glycosyltransferase involved in cell wall biosynthesis [Pedobacter sp. UYP30]|uniref:glycosyltransferase family 2 protein n=1 Tax=Pedobacter sp. UYP30 TaxID=1756400 RepID=UPI00339A813C
MHNPTVALLISTYNWPGALNLVLTSVLAQSKMPDEIIIADDGSGEETRTLVENFSKKLNITHVWQEDIGFRKSLVLNKAVKKIKSDYIIQIDGDIIIHPKFIEDHLQTAEEGYFVQGSRSMIIEQKSAEILKSGQTNLSIFSYGLNNKFNAIRFPLLSPLFRLAPSNPFHLKGCNFAFWKKDFISVNGYYNGFEGWGGEDYEFGARFLHAGVKRIRLKMKALAFHIFHPVNCRANTGANDKIYQATLSQKLTYRDNGYQEV